MKDPAVYASERKDARANHERILQAALEVFGESGEEAEIKDVAARARVGVGTIYRHFESRDALLAAVIDHAHEDIERRIQVAAEEASAAGALHAILRTVLEQMERFGALTEIVMARQHDAGHQEKHDRIRGLFNGIIARGIATGEFYPDLDGELLTATLEALFASGKMDELARSRGAQATADCMAAFLMRACGCGESGATGLPRARS
jgi:AcrR family transcriptional regulator